MAEGQGSSNSALEAYWMPFTANKAFKSQPRLLASARDMHYFTPEGRPVLDATAGLWCVNAGHGREPIVAAIREAAQRLDYAPSFQLGHPEAFAFADQLAGILPEGMDHVFFCNSGSEAVDSALKIALAWQRAAGRGTRTRLIGRERAYHGVGFGGISVGGIVGNRAAYGALLPGVDHLRHTLDPAQAFVRGQPEQGAELADDLERLVGLHGADNIAAVIVEPLAGSTGVLVPPKGYLERLRQICDKHQILLIFDEVITGFGRLGAATAAERLGVTPDIITLAKGLTNAAVPMGAVGVRREIYEGMLQATAAGIELPHGYTYSGHPLAVAAGRATLDLYRDEGLFGRAAELEPHWEAAVHSLRGEPHVKDVRNLGLVAGIELESRPGQAGQRATEVFRTCFDEGLLIRVTGEIIALSPPLIISPAEIDQTVQMIADVLRRTA
jgi:beta-alanine--pyruvate transaminase